MSIKAWNISKMVALLKHKVNRVHVQYRIQVEVCKHTNYADEFYCEFYCMLKSLTVAYHFQDNL